MHITTDLMTHLKEENALVDEDVIAKIIGMKRPNQIRRCSPAKKVCEACNKCQYLGKVNLENIISNSHKRQLLNTKKYVELNDATIKLLNEDWMFRPQMRFFRARVLSGSIWANRANGGVLLVNSVEVYGRLRTADSHFERFNIKKNILPPSSLPRSNLTYKNICLRTVQDVDSIKLLFGTKVFNGLAASSIRLDADLDPEAGLTTSRYLINMQSDVNVEIYIEEEALREAKELAEDEATQDIYSFNIIYQLRRLRSKFYHQSTYFRFRGSSSGTNNHTMKLCSIWTYCNFDSSEDGNSDGRIASTLFQDITIQVIKSQKMTTVEENEIVKLIN
ncbi:hypothetical protein MFLAVUS_006411 [Mucor flavus]|uniref:Uncharacterized protein n=1 Tax=Mucor flavus TaxID=439312 RepID=A0ABP9Z1G0_9FUNG